MYSELRRSLGRPLLSATEALWRFVLRRGPLAPMAELLPIDPREDGLVVVVAPHPDDELLGSGAALAAHRRVGTALRIVWVSDGRSSRAGGRGAEAMAACRRRNALRVAEALGAEGLPLDLAEDGLRPDEAAARLAPLLKGACRIYAPLPLDYHPVHLAVTEALAAALPSTASLRAYAVGLPMTRFLAERYWADAVDFRRRQSLCERYESQWPGMGKYERLARYEGMLVGAAQAELYRDCDGEGYRRAVAWVRADGGRRARALRDRPWSDPLAWWSNAPLARQLSAQLGSSSPSSS